MAFSSCISSRTNRDTRVTKDISGTVCCTYLLVVTCVCIQIVLSRVHSKIHNGSHDPYHTRLLLFLAVSYDGTFRRRTPYRGNTSYCADMSRQPSYTTNRSSRIGYKTDWDDNVYPFGKRCSIKKPRKSI